MDFTQYMLDRYHDEIAEEGIVRDVADSVDENLKILNNWNIRMNEEGLKVLIQIAKEINSNFRRIDMDKITSYNDLLVAVFKRKKKEYKLRVFNICKKYSDDSYYINFHDSKKYYMQIRTSLVKSLRDDAAKYKKYQSFKKKMMIGKLTREIESFMKQTLGLIVHPRDVKDSIAAWKFIRALLFTGIFELFIPSELDKIYADVGGFPK